MFDLLIIYLFNKKKENMNNWKEKLLSLSVNGSFIADIKFYDTLMSTRRRITRTEDLNWEIKLGNNNVKVTRVI